MERRTETQYYIKFDTDEIQLIHRLVVDYIGSKQVKDLLKPDSLNVTFTYYIPMMIALKKAVYYPTAQHYTVDEINALCNALRAGYNSGNETNETKDQIRAIMDALWEMK